MRAIRIVLLLFSAVCVAFSHDVSDKFSSVQINLNHEPFDGFRGHENKNAFNDPPLIINGAFEVPLDHFAPTDSRQLRLVRHLNIQSFRWNFHFLFHFSPTEFSISN